ncbi:hypothetical protein ACSSS7_000358 [Eimeria intestinalis]
MCPFLAVWSLKPPAFRNGILDRNAFTLVRERYVTGAKLAATNGNCKALAQQHYDRTTSMRRLSSLLLEDSVTCVLPLTVLSLVNFELILLQTVQGDYLSQTPGGSESANTPAAPYPRPSLTGGQTNMRAPATATTADGIALAGFAAGFSETSGASEAPPNATAPSAGGVTAEGDGFPDASIAKTGSLKQAFYVITAAQARASSATAAASSAEANALGLDEAASHIGIEIQPKLLREAAVGNLLQ